MERLGLLADGHAWVATDVLWLVPLLLAWLLMRTVVLAPKKFDVAGVHCIVTGGSSGIGKEVAKQLAREGADVTLVARDKAKLKEAQGEVWGCAQREGQRVETVSVDLSGSFKAVKEALDAAVEKLGDAEVLVNCAGYSTPLEFDAMEVEEYDRLLRVNTLGTMYPTRALLPRMKAWRRGRIVIVSSMCGQMGSYGFTAYSASKFALVGLAQALQMEVHAHGVGVSVAYPPDTLTPGYDKENQIKPEVTHKISADGGVFTAENVASDIVCGMKRGSFSITMGAEGWFLAAGTAGFAPCFSVVESIGQVLIAGIVRMAALCYLRKWYGLAADSQRKEAAAAAAVAAAAAGGGVGGEGEAAAAAGAAAGGATAAGVDLAPAGVSD